MREMVVDDVRFWVGVAEKEICFFAFWAAAPEGTGGDASPVQ